MKKAESFAVSFVCSWWKKGSPTENTEKHGTNKEGSNSVRFFKVLQFMLRFDSNICSNFEEATAREWLETNGIGGFASGTISGANTRRYHGILTAATAPPLGRVTMLSKFDEALVIAGRRYEVSTNQYSGKVHPEGFKFLVSFRLDPFPVWNYEVEGIGIEKRVFMVHGENTTVCHWQIVKGQAADASIRGTESDISLELRPLLSFVDYHHLQHENTEINGEWEDDGNAISIHPYTDQPSLFFHHNARNIDAGGFWYNNFEYAIEKERGFDFNEDLFQPFVMHFDLNKPATVTVSTESGIRPNVSSLEQAEIERRARLIEQAGANDEFTQQLVRAADQFVVSRGDGETIIAGYPWFSDWGRDTMVSLSGLTLATNRPEIAKNILLEFSRHISEGMLPNRFPDAGDEAEYNTVDATLWYFEAVRAYVEKTGDDGFVRDTLYRKLIDIIAMYISGTRYNIHIDTDGLLYAGGDGVQLTWMDAKIGDLVITPRTGKPVEIQALWYNALKTMADLAGRFGDRDYKSRYESMAHLTKISFNGVFWNEADECLFDVVENGNRDASVRPNQIFAVSLPHSMLDLERSRKIVEKVERELLTPFGLRSLAASDPRYVSIYEGSAFERDSAYHQGTVWAWLIGPFIDAYRKIYPESEDRIQTFLAGFQAHLTEGCVGQISEIFDADSPHRPRGCPAQAWSVAEILRVLANSGRNASVNERAKN